MIHLLLEVDENMALIFLIKLLLLVLFIFVYCEVLNVCFNLIIYFFCFCFVNYHVNVPCYLLIHISNKNVQRISDIWAFLLSSPLYIIFYF
jgi:hypothetical protein